jgi:uncharacterized protein
MSNAPVRITPELLEMICCPRCRGDLSLVDRELTCRGCGSVYAVVEGIPVLHLPRSESPAAG